MLLRVLAGEQRMVEVWRMNGGDWALDGDAVNAAGRARGRAVRTAALRAHAAPPERQALRHLPRAVPGGGLGRRSQRHREADAEAQREMLWGRERIRRDHVPPVAGVDWTIHGHTVVSPPLRSGNALFIETGIYQPGGRLTLLCLDEI